MLQPRRAPVVRAYYLSLTLATLFAGNGILAVIFGVAIGSQAHFEMFGFAVLAFAAATSLFAVMRLLHRGLDDTTRH